MGYMQIIFCNVISVSIRRTLFKLTQFSICFRKYNCCYSTETFCSTKVSKQVIIKAHHHDKTNNNSWYVYGVWQGKGNNNFTTPKAIAFLLLHTCYFVVKAKISYVYYFCKVVISIMLFSYNIVLCKIVVCYTFTCFMGQYEFS